MKNRNFHKRRFSDTTLFWGFVLAVLLLSHYHIFMRISLLWNGSWMTYLWLAVGVTAALTSLTAKRLSALCPLTQLVTMQSAFNRFGSTWNIFIFLTSFFMLFIQTIEKIFSPLDPGYAFAVSALASLSLCLYGLIEARTIITLRLALHTSDLPPGRERLRIVQLSDLHIGPLMNLSHIKRVVEAAFNAMPDLVVITGDIVDGDVGDMGGTASLYKDFSAVLAQLQAFSFEFGIWAVLGNHDYFDGFEGSRAFIKEAGINLLRTEKADLGDIVIVGADDGDHLGPSDGNPARTRSEELVSSLTGDDEKKFVLLLRHRPVVEPSTVGKFNLQLSGHTHGGQLFTLPSSRHRLRGHSRGLVSVGHGDGNKDSWLYVSNGAGFVGPPMRFLSPAEIVVIDILRRHNG